MMLACNKRDESRLEWLGQRLEEAGGTLLALPQHGLGPQLRRVRWPETAVEETGNGTMSGRRLRPAVPGACEITRMDEAFGWIGLIPQDRLVLRRIVHARSLVSPVTGKHLYSWRKLGMLLGADHKAVQRWHLDGLTLILGGLRKLGKYTC